jgi:hypothetical protein
MLSSARFVDDTFRFVRAYTTVSDVVGVRKLFTLITYFRLKKQKLKFVSRLARAILTMHLRIFRSKIVGRANYFRITRLCVIRNVWTKTIVKAPYKWSVGRDLMMPPVASGDTRVRVVLDWEVLVGQRVRSGRSMV